jgi:hypothetical protein
MPPSNYIITSIHPMIMSLLTFELEIQRRTSGSLALTNRQKFQRSAALARFKQAGMLLI